MSDRGCVNKVGIVGGRLGGGKVKLRMGYSLMFVDKVSCK